MRFYLGIPEPAWLKYPDLRDIPVFVSHTRLRRRVRIPRAVMPVAIDSGGFTELDRHGGWRTTVPEYLDAMERYVEEIGTVEWMSPMDWMCEPWMIEKTGLSVRDHQELTTANYLELTEKAPHLPIIPVVQGWELKDYEDHCNLYLKHGVNLRTKPLVGVGSVCRRQHTADAVQIFRALHDAGVRVHGFGVKTQGFGQYKELLVSSDSMAWSMAARRRGAPLGGCTHKACNYCTKYALAWREAMLSGRRAP